MLVKECRYPINKMGWMITVLDKTYNTREVEKCHRND